MSILALPSRHYRPMLGIFFMCLACSLFPIMNGLVKLLAQTYDFQQIVWARTSMHLLVVVLFFTPRMGMTLFLTRQPVSQLISSVNMLLSTFLFFGAVKFVAVADAVAITFVAPMVVVFLAWPILGERITLPRLVAVVLGFIGVLVIIRPGSSVFHWASIMILGSAVCYSVYQIYMRRVAGVDHPATSVFYGALVGTIIMSMAVPFVWKTPGTWPDIVMMSSLGVLGASGHYCLAKALTCAPANFIVPFNYTQMIGSVIVGYLMFAEIPDAYTWAGTALIVGAGLLIGWQGKRTSP
jgi:drug/metabolite transporter (DMT)-like permease